MKIAIAGYGVEGKSSYRYFLGRGHSVTIVDERTEMGDLPLNAPTILGVGAFDHLAEFDKVIRTPSLPPDKLSRSTNIWSATNEFFAECPASIVGVTGTKGKGTTASLIARMLESAGKTVHLVGNIGTPALDVLDTIKSDDIVVYELSSFQLWDIQKSPHVAVILRIEPDHLNVHNDFSDYIEAKSSIARYQTPEDIAVYFEENEQSRHIAEMSPGLKIGYSIPSDSDIIISEQYICAKSDVGLLGDHNLENIYAATTVALQYTRDVQAIAAAIRGFRGLPHRLELVRTVNNVQFYNDSYSSAPASTKVAINTFHDPIVLIAGGYDRGLDYTDLAAAIKQRQNIKKVLLIGQTAPLIAAKLPEGTYEMMSSLSDAVRLGYELARPTGVVLLSPGCASFDMFDNFTQRGEKFKQIVEKL